MNLRTLASSTLLACAALLPATSLAWGGGPANGYNGYYGAGPFSSGGSGGFNFNTSMRARGNGAHRYYGYNGYDNRPHLRPASPSWILRGVNFKYDSTELTPGSLEILDSVAATLRSRPTQPLEVGGHASSEGGQQYNLELSNRRAQTVRAYLVQRGVNPEYLTYRGYGETRPLVENVTEPGRRYNRRVELTPAYYAQR
jgi:outer membrane protein OmpA-like peptidoglycan-associated protein